MRKKTFCICIFNDLLYFELSPRYFIPEIFVTSIIMMILLLLS